MSVCIVDSAPFKKLVSLAVKGAGRSELILTMCLNIQVKDKEIILTTTDMISHTRVRAEIVHPGSEELFTCVDSETFGKLVAKLPDNGEIRLTSTDTALEVFSSVTGGKYPFPVIPDENGDCVVISTRTVEATPVSVKLDDLKSLLKYNKASVRTDSNMPAYKGYYACDKGIFSYDGIGTGGVSGNACLNLRRITDVPIMFQPSFVELFNLFESGDGTLKFDGKLVSIVGGGIELVGETKVDEASLFPAGPLLELKDVNSEKHVSINRQNAISCMDRLLIFANDQDLFATHIVFSEKGILLNVYDTTATERIEAEQTNMLGDETKSFYINLQDLRKMASLFKEENIMFTFGSDNGLTIEADSVVQYIPYMDNDEE